MTMDEGEQLAFEELNRLSLSEESTTPVPDVNTNVDKENINVVFIGHVGTTI